MSRLEDVRIIVDKILLEQSDLEERRCGYVHLYGVSAICSMLALKRGLDVELCTIAGMLHDIWTYKYKFQYSKEHAKLGSIEARNILNGLNYFNEEEIDTICSSIYSHSLKQDVGNAYEELLKDADVLQHYLYNTSFPVNENEKDRLDRLFYELGIGSYLVKDEAGLDR
jgi:uncharacterized protein